MQIIPSVIGQKRKLFLVPHLVIKVVLYSSTGLFGLPFLRAFSTFGLLPQDSPRGGIPGKRFQEVLN